jgi:hypothetical protein
LQSLSGPESEGSDIRNEWVEAGEGGSNPPINVGPPQVNARIAKSMEVNRIVGIIFFKGIKKQEFDC